MEVCEHLIPENVRESFMNTLIYKDECMRCYSNPESLNGLNVCLKCLQGFCLDLGHSKHHFEKSNHPIVLNIKKIPKDIEEDENKITKLAIGKEGGANIEDHFDTISTLHCMECDKDLDKSGEYISPIVNTVVQSKSAFFESQVGEWELEIKECEHTRKLDQSNSHKIASKALAHCGDCELKANLWLCMTCGNLGCGRQQYGGAEGNNHGIAHYEEAGHPVVCKLGTITPQGTASLYCYKCNDDVEDKKLGEHLYNLGIDIGMQIKTEKTMTEINLEKNLSLTLSKIVEEGRTLTPIFGPCNTGMMNLGNSCYLNSVIQVLFSYDKIRTHFSQIYEEHHKV
jgi:ubiquitin carboxyl-terminal hydrolase 5/13